MLFEEGDSDISSYADDNTPYICSTYFQKELKELETCTNKFFTCSKQYSENQFYQMSIID